MLYQTNNPHGGDVDQETIQLDFSANINPFGTPKRILDAIADALPTIHCYPDPYCRKLVQAISEFEKISEEHILCGNGSAELIYAYCEAIKPKSAVELAPAFSEYSSALDRVGCRVERYILHKQSEFVLQNDFLGYLEKKKPEVLFLCNPNNPTGKLISAPLLQKILFCCKEHNIRLFLDECFLDFTEKGISMKNYVLQHPHLFVLKAFTKSYGMAGVRLGYGICSDKKLLKNMSKTVQPWNVSSLAQAAGIAALKEQEFLEKTRTLIVTEREWLKRKLENFDFWVCPSDANYLLFFGGKQLDVALRNKGIAVRNCHNFYGLTDGWYRIAVRLHEENEAFIQAIKSVYEKESLWQRIL